MINLLKDRLVNRSDKDSFRFTLTCAVCGSVWESTAIPVAESTCSDAQRAAQQEAMQGFVVCRLCANPACENCQVSFGEMTVCSNCAKQMNLSVKRS